MSRRKPEGDVDEFGQPRIAEKPKPTGLSGPAGWPAAKLITAADLVWQFTSADGRCDLAELLDVVFHDIGIQRDKAHDTLKEVIGERFGKPVRSMWTFMEFVAARRYPSLEWQAACWNETLYRLGYKVPAGARAAVSLEAGEFDANSVSEQ